MNMNSIKNILKEEYYLKTKNNYKTFLAFFFLGIFFVFFILPTMYINLKSSMHIIPGITGVTFYYTYTFIYSKLSSKKVLIYNILPFEMIDIFLGYITILFINLVLKKIIIFLIPFYTYSIYKDFSLFIYYVNDFLKILFSSTAILFLSISFNMDFLNKKFLNCLKNILFVYLFLYFCIYMNLIFLLICNILFLINSFYSFANNFNFIMLTNEKILSKRKISILKREYIRFYNEKIIFINHIATLLFFAFFVYVFIIDYKVFQKYNYIILLFPLLINTSSIIFSIEKKYINLIKSLPINMNKFFIAKYIFILSITLPAYIIVFIIFKFMNISGFNYKVASLFILVSIFTLFIKIYFDYKNPCYEFIHIKQIFEHKRRFLFYFICILFFLPLLLINIIDFKIIFIIELFIFLLLFFLIKKFSIN
ncbi:hypothetical protein SAMN02744040_01914 [Tepidibacter thalassicus DSM 15285]|uniref:Uncharacterized protein n=1 Tax=Tepidibacter thalassicus DSM 15285 TaxID=1123350 RepID=A0A1M5SV42_9FIRM|nr:hypothetical protein SAMN02744040_01914 [Tepidibacter thalassicus DSM 15285]